MRVHCIGIGGIGVSAIARYYLSEGHRVSGTDGTASALTHELETEGIVFSTAQDGAMITASTDIVIYSPAIPAQNPERKKAAELGIRTLSYPEALGELTRTKFTIAVCGTHGKSTTTAMIALMMVAGDMDPTVIIGTKVREFGNRNFRAGKSDFLVIEACEYQDSFLHYSPHLIVCPNVDVDHLDYFKTEENYVNAFGKFFANLAHSGHIIAPDSERLRTLAEKSKGTFIPVRFDDTTFSVGDKSWPYPQPRVPGKHNRTNAALALTAAKVLDIPETVAIKSLQAFSGTWRRFEIKGKLNGATVIDDYGHHPTEIKVTLRAAQEWMEEARSKKQEDDEDLKVSTFKTRTTDRQQLTSNRLVVVYQPHQYSRTKLFLHEFGTAFSDADLVIVPDIYRSRDHDESVGVKELVEEIAKNGTEAVDGEGLEKTAQWLRDNITDQDIVITMGAGNIDGIYGMLPIEPSS